MATNPYMPDDPRYQEFQQREQFRREAKQAADRQEQLARGQQQLQEEQRRLQEEQNDYLAELARPQREKDAVREKAKKMQTEKWLADAPSEIRKAMRSMQVPPPGLKNEANFVPLTLMIIGGIVGFGMMFYPILIHSMDPISAFIACIFGVVVFCVLGIPYKRQAARSLQAKQQWEYEQARLKLVVDEYLESCRVNAHQSGQPQECPFCRETVKSGAKKCKYCGELL